MKLPRARKRFQTTFEGPSKTKQSFKDECDLNHILARYNRAGIPVTSQAQPANFRDLSHLTDYQTSLHQIQEAQFLFGQLPAKVRERFANSPADFLRFATDPANQTELIALGLAPKLNTDPFNGSGDDLPDPTPAPKASKKKLEETPVS